MKLTDTVKKLIPNSVSGSVLPVGLVSGEELAALKKSLSLYCGNSSPEGVHSLELASGICSELARLTVSEFESVFSDNCSGKFLERSLGGFFLRLRIYTEYACASGGVMFKPFFDGHELSAECILPLDFIPLETDACGKIVSCAFLYYAEVKGRLYTRIEEHRRVDGGYLIKNSAFEHGCPQKHIPLSLVPEWKSLSSEVFIKGLSSPLFSYFGIPLGNRRFPHSPLGVPVFRRAEELIAEAERQFGRLVWEFEGGELAIDASEDAFRLGKNGRLELPLGKERLYRTNAIDACSSTHELLTVFSPALRDKSIINGLNRMIMFVEDTCGIARGTFSDPSEIARTATEIRAMRQRTYSTVCDIQTSLDYALRGLIDASSQLAKLYGLISCDASFKLTFGDSVLSDSESDRNAEREDVKAGIITPAEFKERWY